MAIVTFTSDLGLRDAYVAVVKARLLTTNPQAQIIDISHLVKPANLADGAFVLASSFRTFPKGTVHLVAVDSNGQPGDRFIAMKLDGHYFVGTDNGLFSLISEHQPEVIVEIARPESTNFPARDVFADVAASLSNGTAIEQLGDKIDDTKRLLGRQVKATRKEIAGHVIKVDHFGNLLTSVRKKDFDILAKDRSYTIGFGRESATAINRAANEVEAGDCYVIFNFLGLMEIGIRNGSAAQLLGLQFDSPVWIKFDE
jgi:S-adenosylmethionine hydrolase